MARGRGTTRDVASRFDVQQRVYEPESDPDFEPERQVATSVAKEQARSIITTNASPDVPFSRSINPFAGCEHGCVYCFARPTHSYRDLSPGIDFETKIFAKANAPELLKEALRKPDYRPETIVIGANTDPYQPVERDLMLTRGILEIMTVCRHPTGMITKSALVQRDLDLLQELARFDAIRVCISITTLDHRLARLMEPRASTPKRRLEAIRTLSAAGVPVAVLASPMIPAINDHELEAILGAAAEAGATQASTILVRLPWETKELFEGWLETHFPDRKARVLSQIRSARGGELYNPDFSTRMKGTGPLAELLGQRFKLACQRLNLNRRAWHLEARHFRPPSDGQLSLFV